MTSETKTVTVEELKSLVTSGEYVVEIDTPDGYQKITNWFDKGPLEMVTVVTTSGLKTRCAHNHLLQVVSGGELVWLPAVELAEGMTAFTVNGEDEVSSVVESGVEECFDFTVDHPNHRYWGDGFSSHNSGKSYIASGNIVKNAQAQGIFVVLIDSENALDEAWLKALDVDTSEEKLLKINMSMIDDVAKTISLFMDDLKKMNKEDRPKVLFVVDSLGMLLTPTDVDQFDKGDLKGDMGRKPKALTALVRNCVNMFGEYNVGLVATNHSYASQDMFDPDDKISGGQGFIYASSIVIAMQKRKLKEDEDGEKTATVNGIRSVCKVMKTRYNKPFETIEIKIPYTTGMNPYSGLVDLFEARGVLRKDGNSLAYVHPETGEVIKQFRKAWERNEKNALDLIMQTFHHYDSPTSNPEVDETEADHAE